MSDLNAVTVPNLGPGFLIGTAATPDKIVVSYDYIKEMFPEGTLIVTPGQNVNDNQAITTTVDVLDPGWTSPGNGELLYTGSPVKVRISVQINQQSAGIRAAPAVNLFRGNTLIAESSTGYTRNTSNHNRSSNTISYVDRNPGTDPVYRILSEQESSTATAALVSIGQFSAEACIPDGAPAPANNTTPQFPLTNGELSVFNFQDQFGSFNMQVGNTTNAAMPDWELLISSVPYNTIPSLTADRTFTIVTGGNTDGTFNHLITGTEPLPAFGNVVFTGGAPTPLGGNGSGLTLHNP